MSQNRANFALIACGANLDFANHTPDTTILLSINALADHGLPVFAASRLYKTPCFPAGAGPDYINAAVCVTLRHPMAPSQILATLHQIEQRFGRARTGRWAGRTLDLDLLAVGDSVLPDAQTQQSWRDLALHEQVRLVPDRLILPHPRLQDRAFVLVPLADVAAAWVHPLLGLSVAQMLALRPAEEVAQVVAIEGRLE